MATTFRRVSVHLTKHDNENLELLCKELGETQSVIIRKALLFYRENKCNDEK